VSAIDAGDHPVINFRGEKVGLGPLRRDLLPLYQRWMNDFEVTRTLAAPMWPMTAEAEEAWFERASRPEREVVFTVYELPGLRPIGNTGLHNIDFINRTAEFGIVIGEKDCWGKGYGTEVTQLMLAYGFTVLGLHTILLRVYANNERAIRAYRRAGFHEIGRWRQARRVGRQRYDVIFMDCLAAEMMEPGPEGAAGRPVQEILGGWDGQ
jgi:RimJ/RimL family protein N-acetyltransferase